MNHSHQNTIIIIAGPTAVGKTSVAIKLAQHYQTEIISADSRQCFKELNIGVAKPSPKELKTIHHYFVSSHSVHEDVNAVTFEKYALDKLTEIFQKTNIAIVVGGTGLYIKALVEGLDEIPEIEPGIRDHIMKSYESNGLSWLQEEVMKTDPLYYATGETSNPQRMMRALEVFLSAGRSILSFQNQAKKGRDFNIIMTGLELPRANLITNINNRVDRMMTEGLEKEARSLVPLSDLNALQTVGYKEMFEHFNGLLTLEEAIERIKINTRQYAKRQMTWFKKVSAIKWFDPAGLNEIIDFTDRTLAESAS